MDSARRRDGRRASHRLAVVVKRPWFWRTLLVAVAALYFLVVDLIGNKHYWSGALVGVVVVVAAGTFVVWMTSRRSR